MIHSWRITLGVVLFTVLCVISGYGPAHAQSKAGKPADTKQEQAVALPNLADIIPLSTELSSRLAVQQAAIASRVDIPGIQEEYAWIEADLKVRSTKLHRLRAMKYVRYKELIELRRAIKQDDESFKEVSKPLNRGINQLQTWRNQWLAEKKRWNEWRSALLKDAGVYQLRPAFAKAEAAIDEGLDLVNKKLETMLTAQNNAASIQRKIDTLAAGVDSLIAVIKQSILFDASPTMFSSRYFAQFGSALWYAVEKGVDEIPWPDRGFLAQRGWVVLLQGLFSLIVIIILYRNKQTLKESKRWRFLAVRPIATGLFIGIVATISLYKLEHTPAPVTWELGYTIVGVICAARLSELLIEGGWKRQFLYWLAVVVIINKLMHAINLPVPLSRLYLVVMALASLFLCTRWARRNASHKGSCFYTWLLRGGCLFLAAIMIAEVWGKEPLASYLFAAVTQFTATVLVLVLFTYMIHGAVERLFRALLLWRAAPVDIDATDGVVRRAALFTDMAIWGVVLIPLTLIIWGVYDNLKEAIQGLLALGFNVGSHRISMALIILSVSIIYGSFITSWIFRNLLMDQVLIKRFVERGTRLSIERLVHYAFISVGFLLALAILRIEITKLTIVLSALGVGVGFGLQSIVNNFVSGLILLFERPVREGDYIEIGGSWSEIKHIGLRATTVQTFDYADVIVPNADLITNRVTNWTLSNRRARIIIPVGVAYGSNVALVVDTLMDCARTNGMLANDPEPQVLFRKFGESSLDFELRVWVLDVENRLNVQSDLHREIDRRFREARIEIAFPQRDLHLRSIDESITLRPPGPDREKK